MFELDPRLHNDTIMMGDFPMSRLLLMNDSTYPWFILVPRRKEVTELYQLEKDDLCELWQESVLLGKWMSVAFQFDKLNVATLGNVVSQLHIHHVGRSRNDPCWPGPMWGQHPPKAYAPEEIEKLTQQVRADLAGSLGD
ncbi:Diadenosine tetraphosphate (Ap4A) hydrolase [Malonomonas rubra DSM 5091]|uniref:Diadenosine tetraphosphate (Ap4A) hydrolase n=1 Tax=Malonomonas rubra DSM 5091 TaxID=1122189 RepID=A0A1M6E0B2_MALRU|nr:HIT domain-containing protein [Malonomonas rubra]SHI78708.1 Diadenosine tetraphosphate (Ap4A) hydrolase [Malonomonas rubra DSM 5091]